jgi:GrpB-like predicted nucleotidyltransferase (UPF0157 family)
MIEIKSYNPDWPEQFKHEMELLKSVFGKDVILIEHIGSTSIPGCSAKPVIDILIVLPSIKNQDEITKKLEAVNYTRLYYGFFMRLFFCKNTKPVFQLHIFQKGYSEIDRFLKFKYWLTKHPKDKQDYINLKKLLAVEYADNLEKYSLAKEEFVSDIEVLAGWCGIKLIIPYTEAEKGIIENARSKIAFDSNSKVKSFIVKKGTNDIGCVFVLFQNTKEVLIKPLSLCEDFYLSHIQQQISADLKMWLKNEGVQTVFVDKVND